MASVYARQAIVTRYHGPTDHNGARVSARCEAGRLTVQWDHALDACDNHAAAARALAVKLGWSDREAHIGGTRDGYVVVFIDRDPMGGTQVTE